MREAISDAKLVRSGEGQFWVLGVHVHREQHGTSRHGPDVQVVDIRDEWRNTVWSTKLKEALLQVGQVNSLGHTFQKHLNAEDLSYDKLQIQPSK